MEEILQNLKAVLGNIQESGGESKGRGGVLHAIDLDADGAEEDELQEIIGSAAPSMEIPPALPFDKLEKPTVISVDCGTCALGESESHIHFALRSAIYTHRADGKRTLSTLRSGVISVALNTLPETFLKIGSSLGDSGFYVTPDASTDAILIKQGVASSPARIVDRMRSWWERKTQEIAIETAEPDSIVLFDGSMTSNTRDVPNIFLESLLSQAARRNLNIVALSKKSDLSVCGKSVRYWLNDVTGACHRPLYALLQADGRASRILGKTHAVRLSPRAQIFRSDVVPVGKTDHEVLSMLASLPSICGYPRALSYAHWYSWFTPPLRVSLRAQVCVRHGLTYNDEKPLHAAFSGLGSGGYK